MDVRDRSIMHPVRVLAITALVTMVTLAHVFTGTGTAMLSHVQHISDRNGNNGRPNGNCMFSLSIYVLLLA